MLLLIIFAFFVARIAMDVGFVRRTLSAEELAGDVELLAADDDDLLAVQELLGDSGRQATEKVALAIDDNLVWSSVYHFPNTQYPHLFLHRMCAPARSQGVSGHAYHRLEGRHVGCG